MPTKTNKKSKKPAKRETPQARKRKLLARLPRMTVDDFMGKGEHLWKSDEELDKFLAMIREARKD